jgi:imidazolonepropionase
MSRSLLVRGARQLLTLRGGSGPRRGAALREPGIIEDGAILIRNGSICEVGPSRRVENLADARDAEQIDAAGRVVMPGFVDSHTHLLFSEVGLDWWEESLAQAETGMPTREELAGAERQKDATPARRLLSRAKRYLNQMLAQGSTTVEAKTGFAVDAASELRMLRVLEQLNGDPLDLIPTYLGAHGITGPEASRPDIYLEWVCGHLLPGLGRREWPCFVDYAAGWTPVQGESVRRYLQTARNLGLSVKLHSGQFPNEHNVATALECGAVSVDHLEFTGAAEIEALARSHIVATLTPAGDFHWPDGRRYAPAREMIDQGVAVALATGFHPRECPSTSMQLVIALACRYLHMSPAEAVAAATINAAHAVQRAFRAGSIESGKDADVLILNVGDYRELAYFAGGNAVWKVLKRGRVVYEEGRIHHGV